MKLPDDQAWAFFSASVDHEGPEEEELQSYLYVEEVGEGTTGSVSITEDRTANPGGLPYLIIDFNLMGGAEVEDVIFKVRGTEVGRLNSLLPGS